MDSTTIGIVVLVIIAIAFFLFRRNRPAPHGTYDDPDVRSGGSIGGGQRGYDDENVRSGGSIGGGPRAYDTPGKRSSGSIGGSPTAERNAREERRSQRTADDLDSDFDEEAEPKHDDRKLKSGGSFGSS